MLIAGFYSIGGSLPETNSKSFNDLSPRFSRPDQTTRDIRSPGRDFYEVDRPTGTLKRYGRVLDQKASSVMVSISKSDAARGVQSDAKRVDMTVNLPGRRFDPVAARPEGTVPSGIQIAPDGEGYYIVQFGMTATDELFVQLGPNGRILLIKTRLERQRLLLKES